MSPPHLYVCYAHFVLLILGDRFFLSLSFLSINCHWAPFSFSLISFILLYSTPLVLTFFFFAFVAFISLSTHVYIICDLQSSSVFRNKNLHTPAKSTCWSNFLLVSRFFRLINASSFSASFSHPLVSRDLISRFAPPFTCDSS